MDPVYYPLLVLPALLNLWAIWHAYKHEFANPAHKFLWMAAGVFLPVVGGLVYLLFGFRNAK